MIIGLAGFISCGKGTVADYLVEEYGFHKIAYADRLKDTVATLFAWPRSMLEGNTKESREFRETPDKFWSDELEIEFTPRLALQLIGTECIRDTIHQDFWVKATKLEILENPDRDYVIPDIRFQNEFNLVQELGGELWRIKRWRDPDWVKYVEVISNSSDPDEIAFAESQLEHIHISERAWIPLPFDRVIENHTVIEDLRLAVDSAIKDLVKSDLSANT